MMAIISDTAVFKDIKISEVIIYSVLFIVSIAFITIAFIKTDAFYGTEFPYDIVYTSDSPSLVKGNVYLVLTHLQNDLRQPLFAVFAAPFTGIPYLIGRLFSASASVNAILLNCVQIVMLFAANFILTKIMQLSLLKRICFMILTCFTYMQLLFIVMMEQYIVAYFWLILYLYLFCENRQKNRIAFWGAGGTLLTSMVLLPLMSKKSPFRDFKEWIQDMVKYGMEFVVLLLVFCRFDVIFNLSAKVTELSGFTGKSITLTDKFFQYTSFIVDCFVAPNAGINSTKFDHVSWQLTPATGVNFLGVIILALCAISAWINRGKKSSLLAAGWVGFSVILLLILGWGTKENGLILYALYFGWAFFSLLFQLFEKVEDKLNTRLLIPIVTALCMTVMAIKNIPAITELLQFAINFYSV